MATAANPDLLRLRDEILRLAEKDRELLFSDLLSHLHPPAPFATSEALGKEIIRRAEAYERGEMSSISFEESIELLRAARKAPAT